MQMLSLAFTPRFVCYTLSILFAATLLLISASGMPVR